MGMIVLSCAPTRRDKIERLAYWRILGMIHPSYIWPLLRHLGVQMEEHEARKAFEVLVDAVREYEEDRHNTGAAVAEALDVLLPEGGE